VESGRVRVLTLLLVCRRPSPPPPGKKKLGWAMNRLDMGRVKSIKSALNVKINDLFLSCAAGTLRNLAAKSGALTHPTPRPRPYPCSAHTPSHGSVRG
jgi:hypothetical protein